MNNNLNAYEVNMGMGLEELLDLNLGAYEKREEKYSVSYIFEEKGLVVDIDRNNRVCQLQMRNQDQVCMESLLEKLQKMKQIIFS